MTKRDATALFWMIVFAFGTIGWTMIATRADTIFGRLIAAAIATGMLLSTIASVVEEG